MSLLLNNPWFLAIRPKTLTAAIAPVLMGTAMAYGDGIEHWPSALLCLLGALTIQIGTNLANDYFDFKKGADTPLRTGPVRVTQAGLISPEAMKIGMILIFALSGLAALLLIQRGGWPIAVIAIAAILSGIFYTAGPRPLGYLGLGDLFVLIFFGPVAVAGTYYVQSFELNAAVLLAGLAPGLLSTAILTVNNLRDIESDELAGKKTLAVRFGPTFAQTEFLVCILAASLIPVLLYALIRDHIGILLAAGISLPAIPAIRTVFLKPDGSALNKTLAQTGILLFIFSILFSLGWIV